MKRVTIEVVDINMNIKSLIAPNFKTGTTYHFFVEEFNLKDFMKFVKESRNEKKK